MHQSSYDKMSHFRQRFLAGRESQPLQIYDIGSQDVNGSYRPLFETPAWCYRGVDMAPGANVDIVLADSCHWREIPSKSADVVVSGQAFEHMASIWVAIIEIARILVPGGVCCIIAPSSGPEHRYPLDCWRIYPDGFVSLSKLAGLDVVEVSTQWEDLGYADGSDVWHDSMCVGRRPQLNAWQEMKVSSRRWLQHRALTMGLR